MFVPRVPERICKYAILIVFAVSFFFIFNRPLDVQHWQWADEGIYFNNAVSITQAGATDGWLGDFNHLVISKAPFFSVFLAFVHILGLPLRLAEFALFLPLPFLFEKAIRPYGLARTKVILIASACLLLIPVAGMDTRLLRTTLFGALALAGLICVLAFIVRISRSELRLWPWVSLAGLFVGLGATTREEAMWLVGPVALTVLLALGIVLWRERTWVATKRILIIVPILLAGYWLPNVVFSSLNYASYGVFSPSLRQNSHFRALYATLCNLKPETRRQYVPVLEATRHWAYNVSPRFAQLQPLLEGPSTDGVANHPRHHALNRWESGAREFFVSNFEFVLAEAIFKTGHQTGAEFVEFSKNTAWELNAAMNESEDGALRLQLGMLPPVQPSDTGAIISAAAKSLRYLVTTAGIRRMSQLQLRGRNEVVLMWHSFLMTSPYHPEGEPQASAQLREAGYKGLVYLIRIVSPIGLLLGLLSVVLLWRKRHPDRTVILLAVVLAWSTVISFSLAMGVVDTVGFPTLRYPGSYNRMGFFPMHYLLLVSSFVTWCAFTHLFKLRQLHVDRSSS